MELSTAPSEVPLGSIERHASVASPARFPWRWVVLGATGAGLLSGLRIFVTYNALGAEVSLFEGISSGLMDWWLWIPFVPFVWRLAQRLHPSRPVPARIFGLHLAAGGLTALAQLLLFSAVSGLVRTLRFGDPFHVAFASPLMVKLAPGFITYLGLVAAGWWWSRRTTPSSPEPEVPLSFRAGREQLLLRAGEIEWVAAAGNYLELHTASAKHLVRGTMKELQARLGGSFVRIHRSTLVRRGAIVRIGTSGDEPGVALRDGTRLAVGRNYRSALTTFVP